MDTGTQYCKVCGRQLNGNMVIYGGIKMCQLCYDDHMNKNTSQEYNIPSLQEQIKKLQFQLTEANEKIKKHDKEMALAYSAGKELVVSSIDNFLDFLSEKYNLKYMNSELTYSQVEKAIKKYFDTPIKQEREI